MKSPKTVIEAINAGLQVFPALRVGQLIGNVVPHHKDLFYLEDEELAKMIWEFIAEYGPEKDDFSK